MKIYKSSNALLLWYNIIEGKRVWIMSKIIIKIIVFISIFFVLGFILITIEILNDKAMPIFPIPENEIICDSNSEFMDFFSIIKYSYEKEVDEKFINNNQYSKGPSEAFIKEKIELMKKDWGLNDDRCQFPYEIIDSEDLYYYDSRDDKSFSLYFYDIENNDLYYIVNAP